MSFFKKSQEVPNDLREKLNMAAVELLAGEYETAINQYEKIIQEYSKNAEIWLEYAHALLGVGRKEDARKAYQSARKISKKEDSIFTIGNPHTMIEFGIMMEEENQIKIAKGIYETLTSQNPELYMPWFLLATIYKKQDNFEKAEEIFRNGIEVSKGDTERLLVGLAEVLTLQHRFEEGLEIRRQATQVNPNFAKAWFSYAVDSYQFGDYDEAENALARACELSKDDSEFTETINQTVKMLEEHLKKCPQGMDEGEYMFSVGVVHFQNQDFKRARKTMERAVRLRPNHAESWTILGGSLAQLKELKEAEKAAKTAISLDSKSIAAFGVLSSVRALQGDMNAAIEVLREGLVANPNEPTLLKMLTDAEKMHGGDQILTPELATAEENKIEALGLLAEGKLDKALKILKKVVKVNPGDAEVWAQIGLIYVNLKKYNEGEKAAREAIKIEDNNAVAWGVLGAALGDAGKLEEAERALNRAVELDPNNASNILPLGFIHMQRGNLDQAQIMLEKAAKLRPKVSLVWQMLAQVYNLQGKENEASEALATAKKFE